MLGAFAYWRTLQRVKSMVWLTKSARKDLDELDSRLTQRASELIGRLDSEPGLGKKLKGPLAGKRSVWLGRTHRVIYAVPNEGVTVLRILHRKDGYR